jgi:hypothetical protein
MLTPRQIFCLRTLCSRINSKTAYNASLLRLGYGNKERPIVVVKGDKNYTFCQFDADIVIDQLHRFLAKTEH